MSAVQPGPQTVYGRFGPFQIVRPLRPCALGERWLALHEREQTSHTVYKLGPFHDQAERRRFLHAVGPLATRENNSPGHILPIEHYAFDHSGFGWAVTPYTGNQHGLVTLADILQAKGGRLESAEADRCIRHLLEAYDAGIGSDIHHGPITPEQILIDTRGRLLIELYGVGRRVAGLGVGSAELIRDQVRSVAELGYQIMTGLPAEEPRIAAGKLVKRLDKAWDRWFDEALDANAGFDSPEEASAALPGSPAPARGESAPAPVVRGVLGRLRAARRSDTPTER